MPEVLLQPVEIRKSDTCLTYVLKRLGVSNKYPDLEGAEFVELFKQRSLVNIDQAHAGDVIVYVKDDVEYVRMQMCIDALGRTLSRHEGDELHFMLVENGGNLSDYGDRGIGFFALEDYREDSTGWSRYLIKYEDIKR